MNRDAGDPASASGARDAAAGTLQQRIADAARRITGARPGEGIPLLWSAAMFGWLLAAYYLMRPTREVFGIDAGPIYEWLWTGTAVGALALTPLFGWLVSRFRRRHFIAIVYLGAAAVLAGFWCAHGATTGSVRLWIGYAFYVFSSVLAVFATMLFWALMAEGWHDDQARRLFGVVTVGGTLGAIAGSALAGFWSQQLAARHAILIAAGAYALLPCFIVPLTKRLSGDDRAPPRLAAPGLSSAVAGVRSVTRSPYLVAIGLFLAGQTLAGTFLYVESRAYTASVFPTLGVDPATALANRVARAAFFARIDLGYNLITLLVQLLLVGRLVQRLGVGVLLATAPLANLAGFAMLSAGPSLVLYGLFEVVQRGTRFALMKPAREMLFTVLPRDDKYKAKQFLDTAVYRGTDVVWVWLDALLRSALGPLVLKLVFVIPACCAWTGLALRLGSMNDARRRAAAAVAAPPSRAP